MSFMKEFDYLKIQYEDIVSATNNFDTTRVIGCGGFGRVYKGELSSHKGQKITVAFKKLDPRLGQGNIEFWKEIMMLSTYKHENLISLKHFCIEGDEMIIVYEYASRGSLDRYLTDASTLTWIQRLNICIGAARGLQFLHDPQATQQRVLHRDIKSANILLDENWMAKVSDFGLSKFGPANQARTYLVSQSVGTLGYCDPLYMELGFLSKESDVYSFGVVMFEVLCGRLCYEYRNRELTQILVPMWRQCYNDNRLHEIILPGLSKQMDPGSLRSFSAIAYQCIKKSREERPTMAEIVKELEFSLDQQATVDLSQPAPISDGNDSYDSKDGPRIEGFQIIGEAKPGGRLLGCGFPVCGTSLCMFQWVRHHEDGTLDYIDGATNPEYVVTADDVDKFIAVECIPMDDQGRRGKIVRLFANEQNKITCDPEMQQEIDNYMSAGQASFSVFLLTDSSEDWVETTFSLTRSEYEININRTQQIFISERYSNVLSIKIPAGLTSQFVLTRRNGSSYPFTFHDVRTRDTFVLTMRTFQSIFLNLKASQPNYDAPKLESNHRESTSLKLNSQMDQSVDNDLHLKFESCSVRFQDRANDDYTQPVPVSDGDESDASYDSKDDDPGIEGFQIIGEAKPGGKLLGCGFPVRGTSLCMFQWVRHHEDGTLDYIDGATNPEYVVTADDVDKFIAVECIPMDNQGLQGEMVRLFANEQNKITCDPEMQQEIDNYMSAGQASFSVFLLTDSSEDWVETTFSLTRSEYEININRTQQILISERYSNVLSIKIPSGLTSQFVLTRRNGSSHPFTFHNVRTRDTFVLTMRTFISNDNIEAAILGLIYS